MNNLFFKLIVSHFIITAIVIVSTGFATSDGMYLLLTLFSCVLYFASGYILTKLKSNWRNYFGIAIIGFASWLLCFALSPNSTNYKREVDAVGWFFYKLFVMVNSPLNFIDSLNEPYKINHELLILFLTPMIISILQFLGGNLKTYKILKENENNNNVG